MLANTVRPRRAPLPCLAWAMSAFLAALPARAQTWTTLRPLPTGNTLDGIVAIDKDLVFACGELGRIFKTTDGGKTWSLKETGRKNLKAIAAGSRTALYAAGDSGTLLATRDGGTTWSPQVSGIAAHLSSVSAPAADTAWAAGGGAVLRTLDGGATWTTVATGLPLSGSLSAVDARIAYAATDRDTVLKTVDGGTTWTRQYVGPALLQEGYKPLVSSVSAVDKDTAFAAVYYIIRGSFTQAAVYRTGDGGAHWDLLDSLGGQLLYAISAVRGGGAYAAGPGSLLASTTDGGATWTERRTSAIQGGYIQTHSAISGVAGGYAYVAGSFGQVFGTADGGKTWAQKPGSQALYGINTIAAVSPDVAFAGASSSGQILKTLDGGAHWQEVHAKSNASIDGIASRDGSLVLAAAGEILRSADGGATWEAKAATGIQYHSSRCIAFADGQTAFAAGSPGNVLKSTDAGLTWYPMATGTRGDFSAIEAVSPLIVYAAGDSGLFLKSKDGGATWDPVPLGTKKKICGLDFLDENTGYVCGWEALLAKTTDGGATWKPLTAPNSYDIVYSVKAWDDKLVFATGYGGVLVKSTDGGATWTREATATHANLTSISIVDASTVFAAGGFGTILKYEGSLSALAPRLKAFRSRPVLVPGGLRLTLEAAGRASGRIFTLQGRESGRLDFGFLEAGPQTLRVPIPAGAPYLLYLRLGDAHVPLRIPPIAN